MAFETGAGYGEVMRYSAGTWIPVGSVMPSSGYAYNIHLASGSGGTLYFAYTWPTFGTNVTRYTSATDWQVVGTAGFDATSSSETGIALAVDTNNVPYVAFVDTTGKVKVEMFDGESWQPVGSQSLFDTGARCPSIAVDNGGSIWVAYGDDGGEGANGGATVMRYDSQSASWNMEGPGPGSASRGYVCSTAIAVDSARHPYVACYDAGWGGLAAVTTLTKAQWVTLGGGGFSQDTPYSLSLVLSPGGVPYVAYQDGYAGPATLMKFTGTRWVLVGGRGFSSGEADYTSLAFDAAGRPFAAFDTTSGPTVMGWK
ncbi:MAG TPA: hypothetical protein VFI08_06360 [Spirochaetia bacterium]|nr:hypothetical protein [Spirochaetia bacterium]